MLAQRIASAIVLIIIASILAYLGGWWFFALFLVGGVLAVREMTSVLTHAGLHPSLPLIGGIAFTLIFSSMLAPQRYDRLIVALGLIAVSTWQLSLPEQRRSLLDWGTTFTGALYMGWLASTLLLIRNGPLGWEWSLYLFFTVYLTDTAAYFGGRAWGRTKFAPTISPKKTWEGAVSGWVVGVLTAVVVALVTKLPMNLLSAALLGLVVSLTATLGDLSMSFIKRQSHVKDTSGLIPGHGGLLDRVDSLLPAAAIVHAYITLLTP